MIAVSNVYKDWIRQQVRNQFRMRLTFHYPSGDETYDNSDIVKVVEKKNAHLVAGELPSIELSIQLINLDKTFDPNADPVGETELNYHDMLVRGVWIDYEYGYDVPLVRPYGYEGEPEETYDPVYGIRDTASPDFTYYGEDSFENITAEAYGYLVGYQTEWIAGGQVISNGELTYDKTTVTILARDYFSLLDEPVFYDHASISLTNLAKTIIGLTDYPEYDDAGTMRKKIVIDSALDSINTSISIAPSEEEATSPKEWLQTIAHAGGVKFYIDRLGYIHLDNEPEITSTDGYTVTTDMQAEDPRHKKNPLPKKLVIKLNDEGYGSPVTLEVGGSGDDMVVENPYVVTTAQGETLLGRIQEKFLPYRNVAEIGWRGDPALDVLDEILLDTDFADDIPAVVEGIELEFDGTLKGSLTLRYDLGGNAPTTVKITGGGSFVIPLGATEPTTTSKTLTCVTDIPTPTYQWSYFSTSTNLWTNIGGATSDTLTVNYDDLYFATDASVKFRCVVNEIKGASTTLTKVFLVKSETSSYLGTVVGSIANLMADTLVSDPQVGDVVLLNNTGVESEVTYGGTYVYNGFTWILTYASDILALSYADALTLQETADMPLTTPSVFIDPAGTRGLTIEATRTIVRTDIRGNYYDSDRYITLTIIRQNIPSTIVVNWSAPAGVILSSATGDSITVDTYSLPLDENTIIATSSVEGYGYSASILLEKAYETPQPMYLGLVETETPTSTSNGDLMEGDYFLVKETFTEGTETYTIGEIWEYDGSVWVKSTDKTKAVQTLGDFTTLSNTVDDAVIGNAIIKDLISLNIVSENILAKNLKVGTGETTEVEFDAIECNGSSSYAETSAFAIAGGDRTFEMWIKPEIIDSYAGLFVQNTGVNDTSSVNIVGFQGVPGSMNQITLAIGDGSSYYISGAVTIVTGVWSHIAGVINANSSSKSAKIYINGTLVLNEVISINPHTGSLKIVMGRIMDKYFKGMARDFRIWNTARTQEQIQDNMTADLIGDESGLVALWKADEMNGSTLTDLVGSNDATASGISWVTDIGITGGTGFLFTAVQDDGTGKSRFDVYYNGTRIFEANPENGRIYFGNNFWYDPSDGAIHTPNDKTVIESDGIIRGEQSNFSSSILNGIELRHISEQPSKGSGIRMYQTTIAENIPYTAEITVNLVVEVLYDTIPDTHAYPIGGKLNSSNNTVFAHVNDYYLFTSRGLPFNSMPYTIKLEDNGTSYDVVGYVYGSNVGGSYKAYVTLLGVNIDYALQKINTEIASLTLTGFIGIEY